MYVTMQCINEQNVSYWFIASQAQIYKVSATQPALLPYPQVKQIQNYQKLNHYQVIDYAETFPPIVQDRHIHFPRFIGPARKGYNHFLAQ